LVSNAIDLDGKYIFSGNEVCQHSGLKIPIIIKLNQDGTQVWKKQVNDDSIGSLTSTKVDLEGNYVAVGHETKVNDVHGAIIVKVSPNGDVIWRKKLGDGKLEYLSSVTIDVSNNYIAVGHESTSKKNYSSLIIKFNSNGDPLLQRKLTGGCYGNFLLDLSVNSLNEFVVVGHETLKKRKTKATMVKFNPDSKKLDDTLSIIKDELPIRALE